VTRPKAERKRIVIHDHPIRHGWDVYGDYVISWDPEDESQLKEIKRVHRCPNCSTQWIWKILVRPWHIYSKYYKYDHDETIVRVSKEDWQQRQVIDTCPDPAIRAALRRTLNPSRRPRTKQ
jgi:hypothetical protein